MWDNRLVRNAHASAGVSSQNSKPAAALASHQSIDA